jgi:hypothetical protein
MSFPLRLGEVIYTRIEAKNENKVDPPNGRIITTDKGRKTIIYIINT